MSKCLKVPTIVENEFSSERKVRVINTHNRTDLKEDAAVQLSDPLTFQADIHSREHLMMEIVH